MVETGNDRAALPPISFLVVRQGTPTQVFEQAIDE